MVNTGRNLTDLHKIHRIHNRMLLSFVSSWPDYEIATQDLITAIPAKAPASILFVKEEFGARAS